MNGKDNEADFLKEEYQALRSEILKRTELQYQLTSLALIAFGTLLTIVFGKDGSPKATLAYPLLTVALAAAWSQHDIRIRQLGTYIKDHIEGKLLSGGKGWEHFLSTSGAEAERVGTRTQWSSRVILFITPILAVILSLFKIPFKTGTIIPVDLLDTLLIVTGFVCIGFTWYLFRRIKTTTSN